jgi:tripartite-type tricarboxylate transporter receptor subunit TctC
MKTLAEFVADARKRPGAIATDNRAITEHAVPMEMFDAAAGIKMLHVPFTGAGPAVIALLGGTIDSVSSGPSTVVQHVKAGKLRVLATWGDKRLASLPDVSTLTEAGFSVVFTQWTALFAPTGTPEPAIAKLRDAARAAVADPKFVAAMATVETPIQYLDAPELQRFWEADNQKLGDAVRRIGKVERPHRRGARPATIKGWTSEAEGAKAPALGRGGVASSREEEKMQKEKSLSTLRHGAVSRPLKPRSLIAARF